MYELFWSLVGIVNWHKVEGNRSRRNNVEGEASIRGSKIIDPLNVDDSVKINASNPKKLRDNMCFL